MPKVPHIISAENLRTCGGLMLIQRKNFVVEVGRTTTCQSGTDWVE
jgi:hypothetical protein